MAQPNSVKLDVPGLPMGRGLVRGLARGRDRGYKDVRDRRSVVNAELADLASQVRSPGDETRVTVRRMGSRAPGSRGSRERE